MARSVFHGFDFHIRVAWPGVIVEASLAPANEHDRWVASMGHGSFDTTMKYYTGVPADHQKQAAEALGEPLFVVSNGPAEDATPVKPRTVGRTEDGVAVETPAKRRFM
jgi:hypothetical protein